MLRAPALKSLQAVSIKAPEVCAFSTLWFYHCPHVQKTLAQSKVYPAAPPFGSRPFKALVLHCAGTYESQCSTFKRGCSHVQTPGLHKPPSLSPCMAKLNISHGSLHVVYMHVYSKLVAILPHCLTQQTVRKYASMLDHLQPFRAAITIFSVLPGWAHRFAGCEVHCRSPPSLCAWGMQSKWVTMCVW